jgi:hypothetical protein
MAGQQRVGLRRWGGRLKDRGTHSEESNGVDGQLINVRITHDGDSIW